MSAAVGLHVSVSGMFASGCKNLHTSILKTMESVPMQCVQVYVQNPRTGDPAKIDAGALSNIPVRIFVHTPHVSMGIWNNNLPRKKYLNMILTTFRMAADVGAEGVVLHLPSSEKSTIPYVLEVIGVLLSELKAGGPHPTLLFETPALRESKNNFNTPAKLGELTKQICGQANGGDGWGYCVDTAHLFCSGVNISDEKKMAEWWNTLDDDTFDRIKLIHWNGSAKTQLGTGKDIHEIVGCQSDHIFRYTPRNIFSTFSQILWLAEKHGIPIVCEVNHGTSSEVLQLFAEIKKTLAIIVSS
jgi:endonuclease IV